MAYVFKDRLDSQGKNVIRQWLEDQPLKVRLKVDAILRNLSVGDRIGPPHVKKIKGFEGVFEIVVKHDKVQYRPLGGYGPHAGEFTLVLGAIEHNDNIRPPDAFATAETHVANVVAKTCRVCEHEYENPAPKTTERS
jgi:hypothetical protein